MRDFPHRGFVMEIAAHFAYVVQRDAGYVGAAECCDLTIAMLADNKSVDTAAVHTQMLCKLAFEPSGIQYRSRANDAVFGRPELFSAS